MSLKDQMLNELKESLRSGDSFRRDVLRLLLGAIKNFEIEKKKRDEGLNDQETLEVIKKMVKQRKDSIEQYENGGRIDLAEKEKRELEIISVYLPSQMSEEKIREEIKKIISEIGEISLKDFGKLMGVSMKKIGNQADGNVVKKILEEEIKKQQKC